MLAILLQATQPIIVQAPSEWSPAAVTQLLLTLGAVATAVIAAVRGEKANAKGDANAAQVQQIHQSVRSVGDRLNDVALATTPNGLAPMQSLTQSPPQTPPENR